MRYMGFDCVDRQIEPVSKLRVGETSGKIGEDLDLAIGEWIDEGISGRWGGKVTCPLEDAVSKRRLHMAPL